MAAGSAGPGFGTTSSSHLWAVIVFFVITSFFFERVMEGIEHFLHRNNMETMTRALTKVKDELIMMAFGSLMLLAVQNAVIDICVPVVEHGVPCRSSLAAWLSTGRDEAFTEEEVEARQGGCPPGYEPFVSANAMHAAHIFIFVLTVVHVLYTATTLLLSKRRLLQLGTLEPSRAGGSAGIRQHVRVAQVARTRLGRVLAAFTAQFTFVRRGIDPFTYVALRRLFILRHSLASDFDFHAYVVSCMHEGLPGLLGVRSWMWLVVLAEVALDGYVFGGLLLPIAIFVALAVGTKLGMVVSQLSHRCLDLHDQLQQELDTETLRAAARVTAESAEADAKALAEVDMVAAARFLAGELDSSGKPVTPPVTAGVAAGAPRSVGAAPGVGREGAGVDRMDAEERRDTVSSLLGSVLSGNADTPAARKHLDAQGRVRLSRAMSFDVSLVEVPALRRLMSTGTDGSSAVVGLLSPTHEEHHAGLFPGLGAGGSAAAGLGMAGSAPRRSEPGTVRATGPSGGAADVSSGHGGEAGLGSTALPPGFELTRASTPDSALPRRRRASGSARGSGGVGGADTSAEDSSDPESSGHRTSSGHYPARVTGGLPPIVPSAALAAGAPSEHSPTTPSASGVSVTGGALGAITSPHHGSSGSTSHLVRGGSLRRVHSMTAGEHHAAGAHDGVFGAVGAAVAGAGAVAYVQLHAHAADGTAGAPGARSSDASATGDGGGPSSGAPDGQVGPAVGIAAGGSSSRHGSQHSVLPWGPYNSHSSSHAGSHAGSSHTLPLHHPGAPSASTAATTSASRTGSSSGHAAHGSVEALSMGHRHGNSDSLGNVSFVGSLGAGIPFVASPASIAITPAVGADAAATRGAPTAQAVLEQAQASPPRAGAGAAVLGAAGPTTTMDADTSPLRVDGIVEDEAASGSDADASPAVVRARAAARSRGSSSASAAAGGGSPLVPRASADVDGGAVGGAGAASAARGAAGPPRGHGVAPRVGIGSKFRIAPAPATNESAAGGGAGSGSGSGDESGEDGSPSYAGRRGTASNIGRQASASSARSLQARIADSKRRKHEPQSGADDSGDSAPVPGAAARTAGAADAIKAAAPGGAGPDTAAHAAEAKSSESFGSRRGLIGISSRMLNFPALKGGRKARRVKTARDLGGGGNQRGLVRTQSEFSSFFAKRQKLRERRKGRRAAVKPDAHALPAVFDAEIDLGRGELISMSGGETSDADAERRPRARDGRRGSLGLSKALAGSNRNIEPNKRLMTALRDLAHSELSQSLFWLGKQGLLQSLLLFVMFECALEIAVVLFYAWQSPCYLSSDVNPWWVITTRLLAALTVPLFLSGSLVPLYNLASHMSGDIKRHNLLSEGLKAAVLERAAMAAAATAEVRSLPEPSSSGPHDLRRVGTGKLGTGVRQARRSITKTLARVNTKAMRMLGAGTADIAAEASVAFAVQSASSTQPNSLARRRQEAQMRSFLDGVRHVTEVEDEEDDAVADATHDATTGGGDAAVGGGGDGGGGGGDGLAGLEARPRGHRLVAHASNHSGASYASHASGVSYVSAGGRRVGDGAEDGGSDRSALSRDSLAARRGLGLRPVALPGTTGQADGGHTPASVGHTPASVGHTPASVGSARSRGGDENFLMSPTIAGGGAIAAAMRRQRMEMSGQR